MSDIDVPVDTLQSFSLPGETVVPDRWWLSFEDQKLTSLVDTALDKNFLLSSNWYALKEAGAFVDIVSAEKWPQVFLQLQSGISRPEPDFVGGENTQLALGADYEVDLWGRIRHSIHAEEHRFRATYYDYKTTAISLSGEITITWLNIKATKKQLQLIEEQIETNQKVLALIRARFASGQVRGVDILRQRQLIKSNIEQKKEFELQLEILQNQLSLLLGRPPGENYDIAAELPELPPVPETGVPLQLVNRRPDVQSAFYSLQASDRELAAAISNKYPRLTFSMTAAVRSNTFIDLFQNQAISLAGSLLQPLFYGGRLRAEVDRAEAVKQQLVYQYGQTILVAFQEIENALISEQNLLEQIDIIEDQIDIAEKTFEQLKVEYLNGSIPYLDVLLTLNQLQELRRQLINENLQLLENRISLYRALAGGFETENEISEVQDL